LRLFQQSEIEPENVGLSAHSFQRERFSVPTVYFSVTHLLRLFLICFAAFGGFLSAAIDSGGGIAPLGDGANHSSIGAPLATEGPTTGLIEILYPPAPSLDSEADADGNGFPDAWEIEHFGATGVDASADADGDGTTNRMEYLAGTNPKSAASVFRPNTTLEGGMLILNADTISGRDYRIWGTPDLRTEWTPHDTISGDGSMVECEFPMSQSPSGRYFLRIEILIPTN
jgi:hypothetical protein